MLHFLRLAWLVLLASMAPRSAVADIEFTAPAAGASLPGGSAVAVQWKDSGSAPTIADLASYQLMLCAGGNGEDSYTQLVTITAAGQFSAGNAASGVVDPGIGASIPNAYFFKMISTASAGGTITNFSPRFSLTGMTGVFPANVAAAAKEVQGTQGPAAVNALAAAAAPGVGDDEFDVPYAMQTGLTKFAPMQPVPPTKITKSKATPLYPPSDIPIATTFLPPPSQLATTTQPQTFSTQSHENTIAAASTPSDDMAKFLARWKD